MNFFEYFSIYIYENYVIFKCYVWKDVQKGLFDYSDFDFIGKRVEDVEKMSIKGSGKRVFFF